MEEKLKELLALEKDAIDMVVVRTFSGPYYRRDRQELIRLLTGEKRPILKCGVYALVEELKKRKELEK